MYVWKSHLLLRFLAQKSVLWDYAVCTSVTPLTASESFALCQPSLTEVSRPQRYSDSWKFHVNHFRGLKRIPLQGEVKQNIPLSGSGHPAHWQPPHTHAGVHCLRLGVPYREHRVVAKEMEEPSGRHKSVGKHIALFFSLTEKTAGSSANTVSWAWSAGGSECWSCCGPLSSLTALNIHHSLVN